MVKMSRKSMGSIDIYRSAVDALHSLFMHCIVHLHTLQVIQNTNASQESHNI